VSIVLLAYLDESGIHEGAEVCVIAGYFGGIGQWRKFESDWRKVLHRFKVPLEKFHAKDVLNHAGIFLRMPHGQHRDFIHEIAETIACYKIYPLSMAIVIEDFATYSEKQKRFLTGAVLDKGELQTSGCPSKPYFVPFMHCVRRLAEYTSAGSKVDFFFGLGRTFAGHANVLLHDLRECTYLRHSPWGERIGVASFPKAKDTPQLQAADFLAYYMYSDMVERRQKKIPMGLGSPLPPPALAKCVFRARGGVHDIIYFDKHVMDDLLEKSRKDQGHWDE
jgi:hypothetical protein